MSSYNKASVEVKFAGSSYYPTDCEVIHKMNSGWNVARFNIEASITSMVENSPATITYYRDGARTMLVGYVNKITEVTSGKTKDYEYECYGSEAVTKYKTDVFTAETVTAQAYITAMLAVAGLTGNYGSGLSDTIYTKGGGKKYIYEELESFCNAHTIGYKWGTNNQGYFFNAQYTINAGTVSVSLSAMEREKVTAIDELYNSVRVYSDNYTYQNDWYTELAAHTANWSLYDESSAIINNFTSTLTSTTYFTSGTMSIGGVTKFNDQPWFVTSRRWYAVLDVGFSDKFFLLPHDTGLDFPKLKKLRICLALRSPLWSGWATGNTVGNKQVIIKLLPDNSPTSLTIREMQVSTLGSAYSKTARTLPCIANSFVWSTFDFDRSEFNMDYDTDFVRYIVVQLEGIQIAPATDTTGTLLIDGLKITYNTVLNYSDATSTLAYGIREYISPVRGFEYGHEETVVGMTKRAQYILGDKTIPERSIRNLSVKGTLLNVGERYTFAFGDYIQSYLVNEIDHRYNNGDWQSFYSLSSSPIKFEKTNLLKKIREMGTEVRGIGTETGTDELYSMGGAKFSFLNADKIDVCNVVANFVNITAGSIGSISNIDYVENMTVGTIGNISNIGTINNVGSMSVGTIGSIGLISNITTMTCGVANITTIQNVSNFTATNATISNISNLVNLTVTNATISNIRSVLNFTAQNATINTISSVVSFTATNANINTIGSVTQLNVTGNATFGAIGAVGNMNVTNCTINALSLTTDLVGNLVISGNNIKDAAISSGKIGNMAVLADNMYINVGVGNIIQYANCEPANKSTVWWTSYTCNTVSTAFKGTVALQRAMTTAVSDVVVLMKDMSIGYGDDNTYLEPSSPYIFSVYGSLATSTKGTWAVTVSGAVTNLEYNGTTQQVAGWKRRWHSFYTNASGAVTLNVIGITAPMTLTVDCFMLEKCPSTFSRYPSIWVPKEGLEQITNNSQINNYVISGDNIGDAQIVSRNIGTAQITGSLIGNLQITADHIQSNAVTAGKIDNLAINIANLSGPLQGAIGGTIMECELMTLTGATARVWSGASGGSVAYISKIQANAIYSTLTLPVAGDYIFSFRSSIISGAVETPAVTFTVTDNVSGVTYGIREVTPADCLRGAFTYHEWGVTCNTIPQGVTIKAAIHTAVANSMNFDYVFPRLATYGNTIDFQINSAMIQDLAITSGKIDDLAISSGKIDNLAINFNHFSNPIQGAIGSTLWKDNLHCHAGDGGSTVANANASGGSAMVSNSTLSGGYFIHGPYQTLNPGDYWVHFRIATTISLLSFDHVLIDVYDSTNSRILTDKTITTNELYALGASFAVWTLFAQNVRPGASIETRVKVLAPYTVAVDYIKVEPAGMLADSSFLAPTFKIQTENIENLAITNALINDLAITTGKIDNLAITNAKIETFTIAYDRLITPPIGWNECFNSGFEYGQWEPWSANTVQTAISRVTTSPHSGGYCLRYSRSATLAVGCGLQGNLVNLAGEASIVVSGWMMGTCGTGYVTGWARAYGDSLATTNEVNLGDFIRLDAEESNASWTRESGTYAVPSTATWIRLGFYSNGAYRGTVQFDDMQILRGNQWVSYIDTTVARNRWMPDTYYSKELSEQSITTSYITPATILSMTIALDYPAKCMVFAGMRALTSASAGADKTYGGWQLKVDGTTLHSALFSGIYSILSTIDFGIWDTPAWIDDCTLAPGSHTIRLLVGKGDAVTDYVLVYERYIRIIAGSYYA